MLEKSLRGGSKIFINKGGETGLFETIVREAGK